jgi:hypothetical protein
VSLSGLFEGHAADKGRNFSRHVVQAAQHDVLARGFDARTPENVREPRTGETSRTHRSFLPLNAGDMRLKKSTPVPRTLERVGDAVDLELGKVCQTQAQRYSGFAGNYDACLLGRHGEPGSKHSGRQKSGWNSPEKIASPDYARFAGIVNPQSAPPAEFGTNRRRAELFLPPPVALDYHG